MNSIGKGKRPSEYGKESAKDKRDRKAARAENPDTPKSKIDLYVLRASAGLDLWTGEPRVSGGKAAS